MNTRKVFKPNAELMPVVREQLEHGLIVNLPVRGYSMRPFLENENDMVTLRYAEELNVGDAVLAEVAGGTYVLHRIIAIDGDNITLMGDGNVRGTEHCQRKDVMGVATHYVYPNKTVAAENLAGRVRLWCWLLPIRRYLLFIYRHIHKANKRKNK